jgi:hypothetical protein
MWKILLLVGGVFLLTAASAAWSSGVGDGPRQDSLVGGGRFGPGCSDGPVPFCAPNSREFSIDAHASPEGGGAYGRFAYGVPELGTTNTIGRVTCLQVEGRSAVAGGYIVGGAASSVAQVFFVYMQDRGTAGSFDRDRSSPNFIDVSSSTELPAGFPNECTELHNGAFTRGFFDLSGGDVQITDAN